MVLHGYYPLYVYMYTSIYVCVRIQNIYVYINIYVCVQNIYVYMCVGT